ncbi:hypothetical protein E2C01_053789 [Portunus trituberculatus]|uniref:Uncharacterized protein n=1 Tax=Portunus trituberculatus TaxID=210409 RepID=A0A5B7GI53_PORTR|nr:hypothetical protein [Portunus trituberculatus]
MPLTILYIVSSPISFSHSSYVRSFSSVTIFVAIFCIRSNLISFIELGDHTTATYSSFRRIMLVIIFFIISFSMN